MITSLKPTKQRIYRTKAALHQRRKMMSSHLSKELIAKFKKKSMPIIKGDEVIIMRGAFSGTKGKIERINRKYYKVFVENVYIEKKNGTRVKVPIDASKVMITSLNLNDAKRLGGDKK